MSSIRGGSQRDRNWERGNIRIAKASTPTATKMAKAGAHHPMTEVNAAPTQAKTTISTVTARPASTQVVNRLPFDSVSIMAFVQP
jgi:septal ring-binding cell division protein DamX